MGISRKLSKLRQVVNRRTGDWEAWLDCFAKAVMVTSTQAMETAQPLLDLSNIDFSIPTNCPNQLLAFIASQLRDQPNELTWFNIE